MKVDNPEQYHFKPVNLLDDLLSIYLNLKSKPNFLLAVARDERSYKYETFKHAATIIGNKALKSPAEMQAYLKMLDDIESTKQAIEQEDEWLGEPPDEFVDPLLATIMEDPVILPISRTVIDRGTIRQHLLSDPHDPFNRTPLKIEDVIDDNETKEKIAAWRAEAREKARKAIEEKKASQGEDKMETDPVQEPSGSFVESNSETGAAANEHKRKADDELNKMDESQ